MDEQEMSQQEMEELLSQDPTPVTRTYRHSKEFYQKKLREAEKEQRAKEKLEGATTKDWISEHRAERLALFESEPMVPSTDPQVMLASARLFAHLLHVKDVQPGESLRDFGTRVFLRWAQGVILDGGILAPRTYRFPLVMLEDTWASFSIFGGWPPDNTGKILVDEPQLPVWPEGADVPINLRQLPELLGEADRRAARKQLQDAQARRHEEPRTIVWTRNRVTGYLEPKAIFVRLSPQEELLRYRLGYRYFAGEFPELRPDQALADISIRARTEDLKALIDTDFQAVSDEIKGRQQ